MARTRLGYYVVGMEGVAIVRHWLRRDPAATAARVAELKELVGRLDEGLLGVELDAPDLRVREGYDRWATTYDDLPNPLIRLEEPAVRALIDAAPPGRALDAACGTGRHAQYLVERGHRVIGVDATPAMLERARKKLPQVDLRVGPLEELPVESASVDLAVCALALTHVPDLARPVAEIARVVRPGGRIIVSDFHPAMSLLGGGALFQTADGGYGLVETYFHQHDEYVSAFTASDLEVRGCAEPRWGAEEVPLLAGPLMPLAPEAFRDALIGIPAALIWDVVRR
jgi:ubiquinone/menaquinone biosynthesis C-methylase UbiE